MDDDLERVDRDSVLAGVHVCRVRSSMLWPMVEGQVRCLAPALDPSYSIKKNKMSQRQETRKAGGKEETVTRISIEGKGSEDSFELVRSAPFSLIIIPDEVPVMRDLRNA